jgi:hypothetical protein
MRARLELWVGTMFAVLAVVTAFEPQWIERLFGEKPDGGSGALEWGIVLVFGVLALVLGWHGWRARRAITT